MYKFDDTDVRRNAKGRLVYRRDLTASELLCFDCEWVKPREDFGIKPNGNPRSQCNKCVYQYHKIRYRDNSDQWRDWQMRHYYNITLDQYTKMLDAQGGVCAMCKRAPEQVKAGKRIARLCIDHDHSCCPESGRSCGKCIRQLLCDLCNHFVGIAEQLGLTGDMLDEYLARWSAPEPFTRHTTSMGGTVTVVVPERTEVPPSLENVNSHEEIMRWWASRPQVPPGEQPVTWGGLTVE